MPLNSVGPYEDSFIKEDILKLEVLSHLITILSANQDNHNIKQRLYTWLQQVNHNQPITPNVNLNNIHGFADLWRASSALSRDDLFRAVYNKQQTSSCSAINTSAARLTTEDHQKARLLLEIMLQLVNRETNPDGTYEWRNNGMRNNNTRQFTAIEAALFNAFKAGFIYNYVFSTQGYNNPDYLLQLYNEHESALAVFATMVNNDRDAAPINNYERLYPSLDSLDSLDDLEAIDASAADNDDDLVSCISTQFDDCEREDSLPALELEIVSDEDGDNLSFGTAIASEDFPALVADVGTQTENNDVEIENLKAQLVRQQKELEAAQYSLGIKNEETRLLGLLLADANQKLAQATAEALEQARKNVEEKEAAAKLLADTQAALLAAQQASTATATLQTTTNLQHLTERLQLIEDEMNQRKTLEDASSEIAFITQRFSRDLKTAKAEELLAKLQNIRNNYGDRIYHKPCSEQITALLGKNLQVINDSPLRLQRQIGEFVGNGTNRYILDSFDPAEQEIILARAYEMTRQAWNA